MRVIGGNQLNDLHWNSCLDLFLVLFKRTLYYVCMWERERKKETQHLFRTYQAGREKARLLKPCRPGSNPSFSSHVIWMVSLSLSFLFLYNGIFISQGFCVVTLERERNPRFLGKVCSRFIWDIESHKGISQRMDGEGVLKIESKLSKSVKNMDWDKIWESCNLKQYNLHLKSHVFLWKKKRHVLYVNMD